MTRNRWLLTGVLMFVVSMGVYMLTDNTLIEFIGLFGSVASGHVLYLWWSFPNDSTN